MNSIPDSERKSPRSQPIDAICMEYEYSVLRTPREISPFPDFRRLPGKWWRYASIVVHLQGPFSSVFNGHQVREITSAHEATVLSTVATEEINHHLIKCSPHDASICQRKGDSDAATMSARDDATVDGSDVCPRPKGLSRCWSNIAQSPTWRN